MSPSTPEPSPVPLTPLDEALLLVFQKMERRLAATMCGNDDAIVREHRNLEHAVADYHQLLLEIAARYAS